MGVDGQQSRDARSAWPKPVEGHDLGHGAARYRRERWTSVPGQAARTVRCTAPRGDALLSPPHGWGAQGIWSTRRRHASVFGWTGPVASGGRPRVEGRRSRLVSPHSPAWTFTHIRGPWRIGAIGRHAVVPPGAGDLIRSRPVNDSEGNVPRSGRAGRRSASGCHRTPSVGRSRGGAKRPIRNGNHVGDTSWKRMENQVPTVARLAEPTGPSSCTQHLRGALVKRRSPIRRSRTARAVERERLTGGGPPEPPLGPVRSWLLQHRIQASNIAAHQL